MGEQSSVLTVNLHDGSLVSSVDSRNTQGPSDPQALSRSSYVLSNQLRYIDSSGHWRVEARHAARMATEMHDAMAAYASQIRNEQTGT